MFQYPVVGNPWQPSAALEAPNQAVSGGMCPTSQDPLDSVRELLGTGPKSWLCKECPTPAAEASERMLDKLEVGLLREPIIGFGTEPSQKASVPVSILFKIYYYYNIIIIIA
jgi:hypothetical protein